MTSFEPTIRTSAPLIGKKPDPEIVTRVALLAGPKSGVTRAILLVVSLVAVRPQLSAARPGTKLPGKATVGVPSPLAMS